MKLFKKDLVVIQRVILIDQVFMLLNNNYRINKFKIHFQLNLI